MMPGAPYILDTLPTAVAAFRAFIEPRQPRAAYHRERCLTALSQLEREPYCPVTLYTIMRKVEGLGFTSTGESLIWLGRAEERHRVIAQVLEDYLRHVRNFKTPNIRQTATHPKDWTRQRDTSTNPTQ